MMEKRKQILREIGESPESSSMDCVFDEMDKYRLRAPSKNATRQLINTLKTVMMQETPDTRRELRFRDILAKTQERNGLPVILQLVGLQTTLMSRWFIVGTVIFLALGLMLSSDFSSDASQFLITVSPILGLLTLSHEYRAQLYKVEELESVCRYSPVQVAAARIFVVLGYNVILGTVSTLLVESTSNVVFWKLIINWLGPLFLILGIALAASLTLGILQGCLAAAAVWLAQITLMENSLLIELLSPYPAGVAGDIASMILGIGLMYFSLRFWRWEIRLFHAR